MNNLAWQTCMVPVYMPAGALNSSLAEHSGGLCPVILKGL